MTVHKFTLMEVLAAMLLVGLVIPVAVHAILTGNRAHVAAERREIATRLASTRLKDIVLNEEWLDAETEGTFEEHLNYQWELESDLWDEDDVHAMRRLELSVHYLVQGIPVSVTTTTLVREVTEE